MNKALSGLLSNSFFSRHPVSSQRIQNRILAIESTEQACSVALYPGSNSGGGHSDSSTAVGPFEEHKTVGMDQVHESELIQLFERTPRKHSELLLPMVEYLLSEANLSLAQLDAIAFACGPGSFTGLRIATGVVQGLAYGADLPVIPISSLASLAHTAFRTVQMAESSASAPTFFIPAFDARMNEVYVAVYQVNGIGDVTLLAPEKVCAPQDIGKNYGHILEHKNWVGVGSGWCYREELEGQLSAWQASLVSHSSVLASEHSLTSQHVLSEQMIEAQDVLYLAQSKWTKKETVAAEQALPVYLRDTVTWKKLPGRDGKAQSKE